MAIFVLIWIMGKKMEGNFGRHVLVSGTWRYQWNGCEKKADKGILSFITFFFSSTNIL